MKKLTVQIVIHIAAWLCFLMLPFAFYPRPNPMDAAFFTERYFNPYFIVNTVFIIAFYYCNTYLFVPRLFDRRNFVFYTVLIFGLMIIYGLMPRIYHALFGSINFNPSPAAAGIRPSGPPRSRPILSAGNIVLFLLVFVFSTGIKVINQWLRSEQRNKEIANEKLKAELSFLKAQINPHFLFNTLNNIYALASAQSEHTAAAVMKLSSIMRYVLTEARNDLVPLEKEIQFTSHYIELQKMRLTDKTIIDFTVQGDPLGRQIAPLLLLPFVENAFKYGISTRERSPIRILLEIKKDSLDFYICNQKHLSTMLRVSDNTGIGISNTKRRLDLFYEDKYALNIEDKSSDFSVKLKIPV
ncbi:MAG TPA: sensor histidine kinase [Puia sp.]|uniref:sensor histidine kinase n=1 Tax=Puia sp. TaxID=2045100 RepID=UPI002BA62EF4|nr:sensor histidine kinase [Puia sp.]HVU96118.1 sensor histidine kinase [Puia sp.]